MFLEPETKKLIESILDSEVKQELFDQCVQQFGNLPDGLDMFMITVSYYEQLDNYLDEEAIYFNDYWLLLDHYETQDMKLAEDKLVFVYTEMMQNSCYSEKYAEFFKKSLHYCIPF